MKTKKDETKILSSNLFPVVGIGASAGGLDAFKKLLKAIPENSGMAYVLVQHLDPNHESMLPEILQKVTKVPVLEISDDLKVLPNHIYVIPSNKMMVANDGVLQLSPRPPKGDLKLNLPIDLFFTSLAEVHQSHAIGVVLSGTASDGTKGLKAIKDHGGITFAQDENSATHQGMPNNAVNAGVVDFILPPEQIPAKLLEVIAITNNKDIDDAEFPLEDSVLFKQMLSLLRIRKGIDFSYYKQSTIRRRILRRMAINRNESPSSYLTFLRGNKFEQDALYLDLLIPVTGFFRDLITFEYLSKTVLPGILKNKPTGEVVRVWVAGCSTGEEAYSIGMCFKELLGNQQERVQIFATDVSEPAIAKARLGIYSKSELDGVSPQRLQDYFTKYKDGYQINKVVRDMCVFARHNFLKDPPFGKMDLISCRNVLIYMDHYLQKRALTTFHYSLNKNGFLLLGKSETITIVPDLFTTPSRAEKLFTRKDVPGKFMHIASQRSEQTTFLTDVNRASETVRTDFEKTADDILLSKYTPAGVVVNEAMVIVHFRGNTTPFLQQSPGKPSHNLLVMAKQGLAFELRNILHKAKKKLPVKNANLPHNPPQQSITKENIPLDINGSVHYISIEVISLPNTIEPHFLILFHNHPSTNLKSPVINKTAPGKIKKDDKDLFIRQLEQELWQSREDMRSITEDQEVVNEELQSANEELMSGSEELQSLNEELETSKEELQSTNEELTVVNQEMISLNDQVTSARDYSEAIVANIRTPLLALDKNLRIKTANRAFYKTFQVSEPDTAGKLIYDIGNKQWNIPALRTLLEQILPEQVKILDYEVKHTFQSIGERIILLNAHEIRSDNAEKFILLALEDVTEKRQAEKVLRESSEHLQHLVTGLPAAVYSCDVQGRLTFYNDAATKLWGRKPELGKDFWHSSVTMFDKEGLPLPLEKSPMDRVLKEGRAVVGEEIIIERPDGSRSVVLVHPQPEFGVNGQLTGALNMLFDITEQVTAKNKIIEIQHLHSTDLEKKVAQRTLELSEINELFKQKNSQLEKMNEELQSFTYVASHDLQEPLRKIQTFSKLILEKENQGLSDNGKDYFHRMQNAAKRMQTLIEDLLSFSRVNSGERKFENTDLNKILIELKNDLKEIIDEKKATIDIKQLGSADIIRFQFHQLMQNLIVNALKFSNPGKPPHIVISSKMVAGAMLHKEKDALLAGKISPEKDYCQITVSDNGIGFEPKYKDQIFEVFQKLHGKNEYAGTGIGLSIVKKIVENHNGIITATGDLGNGAKFDIYIPQI